MSKKPIEFTKKTSLGSGGKITKNSSGGKNDQNSYMLTRKKSKPSSGEIDDPLTHLVNTFDKRAGGHDD